MHDRIDFKVFDPNRYIYFKSFGMWPIIQYNIRTPNILGAKWTFKQDSSGEKALSKGEKNSFCTVAVMVDRRLK